MKPPARRPPAIAPRHRPAPRPARPVVEPPAEPAGSVDDAADDASEDALVAPEDALAWRPVRPPAVSQSAERFAERAAHRRRVRLRTWGAVAAAALVVAGLGWVALGSEVFALDLAEVSVTGEGTVVEPGAVAGVVAPHAGTPLPRLDTLGLRRDILEVPGVRSVELERQWPRGLAVTVVAREPVAAVPSGEGDLVLLDAEGVQVGRVAGEPGLPVVQVPLEDDDARALQAVLTVLDRMPEDLAETVVTIEARSQDTVAFTLPDGSRVEWGSADQVALKAEVLATLRRAESGLGPRVFDVSAPTAPITRPL